jgi:hypothetical protein
MPELLSIPFNKISDQLYMYLCSLYQSGENFPYPLQQGQRGSLFGTAFTSYVAHMLGRTADLPGRQDIAENILALRNPETGLFSDSDIKSEHFLNPSHHSELYVSLQTTSFCYSCLKALNVDINCQMPWLDPLLPKGEISEWLGSLAWGNPWLVSNLDMFLGIFLLNWQSQCPKDEIINAAVDEYFAWHDQNQDNETGFWGDQRSLFNAMAGGYHIYIHYDYANRKIHYLDKIIDSTLQLVARDGLFVYGGGGGSCEDMDAIDILIRCSLRSDHRKDEIKKVLLDSALMLSTGQLSDGGFSWRVQPSMADLFCVSNGADFIKRKTYNFLFKVRHRSHYASIHNYSSLQIYPFKLNQSDTWSSWFRPLALAYIAQRYPDNFSEACEWNAPDWAGLGYDPFLSCPGLKAGVHG